MRLILTALIFLAGMFDLFMGLSFLIDPAATGAGAGFSIAALNLTGTATIRADMTAFFCVSALCMMWGAWRRNADLLLVPAALFGTAMVVRLFTAATMGTGPSWAMPIAVEAFHFVLLIAAWRYLPHLKLEEIAG